MPIYEYECRECGHYFDVLQKVSDEPLKFCPDCGEAALKKLLSAPRFRLKGSGWYETDFKGEKDRKRNLAEGDSREPAKQAGDGKKEPETAGKETKKGAGEKPAKSAAKQAAGSKSGSAD